MSGIERAVKELIEADMEIERLKALITELADALVLIRLRTNTQSVELSQLDNRAREATNGR
jgi:hypothetical protein